MNSSLVRQSWAMSAVLVNMFGQGMIGGYPTSLLPGLRDPNSSIKADLNTASWLASSPALSCIIGFMLTTALMDVLGRKITNIMCTALGLLGWLLIYFAADISSIMCGRVLGGISAGATISLGAIVIGEYTTPKYRGTFLNLKTAAISLGNMFIHGISYYAAWRIVALIAVAPYIVALLITFTWPESPAWLVSRQQYERGEQAFYWLRGRDVASKKEIDAMIAFQLIGPNINQKSTTCFTITKFFKKFTRKDFLKPLMIAVVGAVLLETCGRHYFPAYALQIVGEMTKKTSDSFYYTLILDAVITVSALSSSVLVKMMKRRTLLFSTGFTATVILSIICVYLFLTSRDLISKERSWIPMTLTVVYFILVNLGPTPITTLALLEEIFPLDHRGVSSAISGISLSLCASVTLKMIPQIIIALEVHGMFAVFGAITVLTLVTLYFTLPETKDRTLQEIECYFRYGRFERVAANDEEENLKIREINQ